MSEDRSHTLGLHMLLFGASNDVEILRFRLTGYPGVAHVHDVSDTQSLWTQIRTQEVMEIIVDLSSTDGGPDSAARTIFRVRDEFPEILFALMGSNEEFAAIFKEMPTAVATRLSRYRRVARDPSATDLDRLVSTFVELRKKMPDQVVKTPRFKYDVAMSFAGEDRHHSLAIAKELRAQDVQVFLDEFELAETWGENLYDKLHEVYSKQSRHTMIFISPSYAEKMWTNHERKSAQARALQERDRAYLLPVLVEPADIPGLTLTTAYLNISMGYEKIAALFIRKLGGLLAAGT